MQKPIYKNVVHLINEIHALTEKNGIKSGNISKSKEVMKNSEFEKTFADSIDLWHAKHVFPGSMTSISSWEGKYDSGHTYCTATKTFS